MQNPESLVQSISAVTLATHNMRRAVDFYEALGLRLHFGGRDAAFSSFAVGSGYLNLILVSREQTWKWWGRLIFAVEDVDAMYAHLIEKAILPSFPPRDAEWGERYFHVTDFDGHEVSFVHPLATMDPSRER
jgi:catechol 2,3-dioxygenase-like lactoylglutathione lyase family enzyme